MKFKLLGPLALLAALVIGDQIRIHRPGHKYRLTVAVETPNSLIDRFPRVTGLPGH